MQINLLPTPAPHARWPLLLATIFLCVTLGGILLFEADERATAGRIYPGVIVGGIDIGGRTPDDAEQLLENRATDRLAQGFAFIGGGKTVSIGASFSAAQDLDLTYDVIRYDTHDTVRRAMHIGRSSHVVDNLLTRIRARYAHVSTAPIVTMDEKRLLDALRVNFADVVTPVRNATLTYTLALEDTPRATMLVHGDPESLPAPARDRTKPPFAVTSESGGTTLTYRAGMSALREDLRAFRTRPITLARIPDAPRIRKEDVTRLVPEAEEVVRRLPKTLHTRIGDVEQTFALTPDIVGHWITVEENREGTPGLTLDGEKIKTYLATLAESINIEPREAKFSLADGRVQEFQASRVGHRVNREATLANIVAVLLAEESAATIDLVIDTLTPKAATDTVNEYGIREIIGVGHSNFKGSPPNRRHNIRTGAEALHGILIAPGEEFSLLKTLGEIDGKHGYKPELVIKGNKTIPEFGGGLCQIGTTVFRAAMASGLPITARQNHSYSVTYYLEDGKPGKDATIYNPKPDFSFLNDTGASVLIQARIDGDDLYFEFWGTKDGRSQEQTEVKTWGFRRPAPTKIIETEDLPEGQKKCTERPHNGVNAEFTYIVTMPDGTKKEQIFRSSYRPWQEVCLVGVPKGSLMKDKQGDLDVPAT